uniref:Uncharacterized protein n=1 Tax=Solanum lycopersicum TaxID=4081 RepID=A0A3Q7GJ40_SOLLC
MKTQVSIWVLVNGTKGHLLK